LLLLLLLMLLPPRRRLMVLPAFFFLLLLRMRRADRTKGASAARVAASVESGTARSCHDGCGGDCCEGDGC
jgi:hypothetical protein